MIKKETVCNGGDLGSLPGQEDPLEKGKASHSSILAWRIPWSEEPGGLQSVGLQESDATVHAYAWSFLSWGVAVVVLKSTCGFLSGRR